MQLAAWVRNRAGRVVLHSNEIEYLHVADRHATRLFQTLRIDWYKVGVLRCLAVVVRRRRLSRGDVSPTPASPGATAGTPELHPAVGDARVPGSARTSRAPKSLVVGPHAQDVDHVLIRKDLVDEAVLNVDAP